MKYLILYIFCALLGGCNQIKTVPTENTGETVEDSEERPDAALTKVIEASKYVVLEDEIQSIAESSDLEIALENMLSRLVKSVGPINSEDKGWVEGVYLVKKGDTLSKIVQESVKGTKIRSDFILDAIVKLNPSAFVRGNPNWMFAGAKLRFPDAKDFSRLVFTHSNERDDNASSEDPYAGWITYP